MLPLPPSLPYLVCTARLPYNDHLRVVQDGGSTIGQELHSDDPAGVDESTRPNSKHAVSDVQQKYEKKMDRRNLTLPTETAIFPPSAFRQPQ